MTSADTKGNEQVDGFRVFVGNLSYSVDTDKLKEFFGQAGNVYGRRVRLRGTRMMTTIGLCL